MMYIGHFLGRRQRTNFSAYPGRLSAGYQARAFFSAVPCSALPEGDLMRRTRSQLS